MMIYLFVTNDLFKYIIQYFTLVYVLITAFCQMRSLLFHYYVHGTAHGDTHTLMKHVQTY